MPSHLPRKLKTWQCKKQQVSPLPIVSYYSSLNQEQFRMMPVETALADNFGMTTLLPSLLGGPHISFQTDTQDARTLCMSFIRHVISQGFEELLDGGLVQTPRKCYCSLNWRIVRKKKKTNTFLQSKNFCKGFRISKLFIHLFIFLFSIVYLRMLFCHLF